MTADVGRPPMVAGLASASLLSRIYGFGSVYAKTLRDSRLSFLIVAGLTGGLMLSVGAALGADLASPAARLDLVHLVHSMPLILAGISGNPVNIGTLGGYLSWKYGPFFEIIVAIWSILALSGTLATEAERGSLDLLAVTPYGKRRLALEKLGAHLTILALVVAILAVCSYLAGSLYGQLPIDKIPWDAAIDFALLVGLIGVASGAVAFALAPVVGRASAAGIAGIVLAVGYLLNGYQASVPAFRPLAGLTWFGWTANNLPLAGQLDWLSLVPVAIAAVILLAVGVEAFVRRDVGITTAIRWPGLPAATLGTGGPLARSFGDRLPVALGWGIGIGLLGFIMGAAARSLADALAAASLATLTIFKSLFPNYDLTSAGGLLELVFVGFGFMLVGFAAATLVAGWASDESRGRLEIVLSTPIPRWRWAVSSGLGIYAAMAALTVVVALGIGIGASLTGGDVLTPIVGTIAIGLYGIAMAAIGLAVGGLFRGSIAAEIVAGVVIATFLIDVLAPALSLPDWVHQLALSSHLGQPMLGVWDWTGIGACLVLAIGGLLVSAWGIARRDVAP
jgi:ABC-2 type transport system permease protein